MTQVKTYAHDDPNLIALKDEEYLASRGNVVIN